MPAKQTAKRRKTPKYNADLLPQFCDFSCPHADFPPVDAVGACRREQGVYCKLLDRFNNRNNRCLAKD